MVASAGLEWAAQRRARRQSLGPSSAAGRFRRRSRRIASSSRSEALCTTPRILAPVAPGAVLWSRYRDGEARLRRCSSRPDVSGGATVACRRRSNQHGGWGWGDQRCRSAVSSSDCAACLHDSCRLESRARWMSSAPKSCSAAKALCAVQRSARLAAVCSPPSAKGFRWWSSRRCVSRQRCPEPSTCAQRPWSRSKTARRTAAGTYRPRRCVWSGPGLLLSRISFDGAAARGSGSASFRAARSALGRFVAARFFRSSSATKLRRARSWSSSSGTRSAELERSAWACSTSFTYSSPAVNCTR
jgi:hypothetical protein